MAEADDGSGGEPGEASGHSLFGALAGGAWKLATEGPRLAVDLAQKGLNEAERMALVHLRRRMDAVGDEHDPAPTPRRGGAGSGPTAARDAATEPTATAASVMADLLDAAQEQMPADAYRYLALRIVRQLVPDEARIVAALSDGRESALIHLGAGPRIGKATQRWLENVSAVGREAGVQLLDLVPDYVDHLRQLGLVETGAEDPDLQVKYQLLEADTRVREACKQIEAQGLKPRFFRGTLRLSADGRTFWAACNPAEENEPE